MLAGVAIDNVVHVRPTESGQTLAVRVQSKKKAGDSKRKKVENIWKLKQRTDTDNRVLLIPKNAPASKIHWLLDEKESIPEVMIVWKRRDSIMTWVPVAGRQTTIQQRAERCVSMLSPVFSPKPRTGIKNESHGCSCAFGDLCKNLRKESTLPSCDPRLAKIPKALKVCHTGLVGAGHCHACTHTVSDIHMYAQAKGVW